MKAAVSQVGDGNWNWQEKNLKAEEPELRLGVPVQGEWPISGSPISAPDPGCPDLEG